MNDRIEEIREFFERKISMPQPNDDDMKIIGMLVLLDCLAQHYAYLHQERTQEALWALSLSFRNPVGVLEW